MGKQRRARVERAERALARQRARRRNRFLAAGGGLVILGLLIAIVVALINAAQRPGETAQKPMMTPAAASATGALTVGAGTAPVTVDIYLDYMCPYCGRFERANSAELDRLVADGTIRVRLYPLSFLDEASKGTRYSTRAANAVATVADGAPEKVLAFSAALFARQPAEGSAGLPQGEIAALAAGVGVPSPVVSRFADGSFEPWVAAITDSALRSGGITGTPTVKINGEPFTGDLYTAGPLSQAIATARGRQ